MKDFVWCSSSSIFWYFWECVLLGESWTDWFVGCLGKHDKSFLIRLQDSLRLLVMWVIPCCLLKTAREIIRIMYVHHESWWQSGAILIAFVFSWTFVMIIILSACVLFHLVCTLQIIHFEDYGKLLERESDVVALLQEHARLRYYLSKISHRFRIYLLLQFFIVTVSQFMFLFQTTGYNGMITFINGGDFAVSSTFCLPLKLLNLPFSSPCMQLLLSGIAFSFGFKIPAEIVFWDKHMIYYRHAWIHSLELLFLTSNLIKPKVLSQSPVLIFFFLILLNYLGDINRSGGCDNSLSECCCENIPQSPRHRSFSK